jgi:hypothetical protein
VEVSSHLQKEMIPRDPVSANMHAWVPGACIVVWAWISLRSHEASTHEYFSLRTIVKTTGSESKVHIFQAIFFQEILQARVTTHLARFHLLTLRICDGVPLLLKSYLYFVMLEPDRFL